MTGHGVNDRTGLGRPAGPGPRARPRRRLHSRRTPTLPARIPATVELPAQTTGLLLVIAIALGAVAVIVAAVALVGQRRVRTAYQAFSRGSRDDVLTLLQRHIDEVRALRRDVAEQRRYADQLRGLIAQGVSRVATERYDAFDDMGGHLSFSTAFLDEHANGLVVTSINGRTDTRVYAKAIVGGRSQHNLSDEERRAITKAMRPPRPRPAVATAELASTEGAAPVAAAGPRGDEPRSSHAWDASASAGEDGVWDAAAEAEDRGWDAAAEEAAGYPSSPDEGPPPPAPRGRRPAGPRRPQSARR